MAYKYNTEIKGTITNVSNGNLEIYVTDEKIYMVLPYKTIQDLRGATINDLVKVIFNTKTKDIRCVTKIQP